MVGVVSYSNTPGQVVMKYGIAPKMLSPELSRDALD